MVTLVEDFDFKVRMTAFTGHFEARPPRETFRTMKKSVTTWNRTGDHKDESDGKNH